MLKQEGVRVEEAGFHPLAASCDWLGVQMRGAEEGQRLLKEVGPGVSTPRTFRLQRGSEREENHEVTMQLNSNAACVMSFHSHLIIFTTS